MEKKVTETLVDDINVDVSLDDLIDHLNDLKTEFKDKYHHLYIDTRAYYDSVFVTLYGERYETDEEYQERVSAETLRKEKQREKDLRDLEEIKKRLGME